MEAKHNVSLIITGMVICLFVVFIVLAIFLKPYYGETQDIADPQMRQLAESMAQTTWWMTVALVMLPIMLILIVIAGYLFISAAKLTAPAPVIAPVAAPAKPGLFGSKPATGKVNEASAPTDVLDLRYARGEITRDQYMAMKADMKVQRI
jgi:NADH:ubiquinone oxidoreductase subunit 5 (subunit L)/multisubunit Na+/H+ antiporter MnhA subunit